MPKAIPAQHWDGTWFPSKRARDARQKAEFNVASRALCKAFRTVTVIDCDAPQPESVWGNLPPISTADWRKKYHDWLFSKEPNK